MESEVLNNNSYISYFNQYPGIKKYITTLDSETSNYFWEYIDQLESNGKINITPLQDLSGKRKLVIGLTKNEIKHVLAAKYAHAIWIDHNNLVPWRLNDFSDEDLRGLFDENLIFSIENHCPFFYPVVDYEPTEVYDLTKSFIKDTALESLYAILDNLRSDFYAGEELDGRICTVKECLTYRDTQGRRRAWNGCSTMSHLAVAMARSINIPGYVDYGWVNTQQGNHASAMWPALGKVLIHGDDLFSYSLNSWMNYDLKDSPISKVLMPYAYFSQKVEPCRKYTICADRASDRNKWVKNT